MLEKYPLLSNEILKICEEMKMKIKKISNKNFFCDLSYILGLDAKLQIILEFSSEEKINLLSLNEDEIITMSKKDYIFYFQEITGRSITDSSPHSIHFSVK